VSDIINLLPDHIANQIAAGEVIQRPASAVKELLENAVDAGATQIHLLVKDAGKELIKVIDNGKGMSTTDARMSFERHATSKIQKIEDLFSIRTMGFRGEALASIAAVAQVELKTKQAADDAGTLIQIENSTVLKQEPCGMPNGTSLAIKNLFYNVPARRNFLKSNTTELKNIVDEFTRVAMAFPNIGFRLTNNDTDIYTLDAGNLKQRIVALLGSPFNAKLVATQQDTDYVKINGYIGTPQAATKTRGNQYFFVNNRFIKSAYLNHAVSNAYQHIIAKDDFPAFVLFLDIDPDKVDANVHPTKQEIKFQDEKIIYAFVNSAVKHAISKHSIAPSIDFDIDPAIAQLSSITQPFTDLQRTATQKEFLFNSFTQSGTAHLIDKKNDVKNWQELYKIGDDSNHHPSMQMPSLANNDAVQTTTGAENELDVNMIQLFGKYILYPKANGMIWIDIVAALERIAYDNYAAATTDAPITIQKCLHPITFELSTTDALLLTEVLQDLLHIGYEIEHFGGQTFIIQGMPADINSGQEIAEIEAVIEQIKYSSTDLKINQRESILRSLAWQKANRTSLQMSKESIKELCTKLFQSTLPTFTPRGKKTMINMGLVELEKKFSSEVG
jgi:DNA mismatch repair protein MutL